MKNIFWIIIIIIIIIGAFLYFGNDKKTQNLEKENKNETTSFIPSNLEDENVLETIVNETKEQEQVIKTNVVEITMDAGNYFFTPNKVIVKVGDTVKFKITNKKGFHNFKIDDLGIFSDLPLNKEKTVEFVVPKKGEFEYYCAVGNHRELGMFGILEVKE